ncbi:hypothetical protein [Candidatus Hodarchaeum mangrovi]
MDTDTIREKFIRSGESLDRLADDIKQLIFSRAQEFRESRDYLETLIKEKETVDNQITEQEVKIASHQEEISTLANSKDDIITKRNVTLEEINQKKNQIEEKKFQLQEIEEKMKQSLSENELINTKISKKRTRVSSLTQENSEFEKKLNQELEEKKEITTRLRVEINELKEANSVISYLLEESAEDIPEVDILAIVMYLGRTSIDGLKEALKDHISPVIITRTLGRMTEKGLLDQDENTNQITIR